MRIKVDKKYKATSRLKLAQLLTIRHKCVFLKVTCHVHIDCACENWES